MEQNVIKHWKLYKYAFLEGEGRLDLGQGKGAKGISALW